MSGTKKVANLVVDSGAFILRSPIQDYGENIFTLSDVVSEIKDAKTRESLQVLPYELKYREPTEEDVKYVAHFAKKTGDFGQLSVSDMRVIALTVRLEKEINNGVNLREAPTDAKVMPAKPPGQAKDVAIRDMQFFGYDVTNKLAEQKKDEPTNGGDEQSQQSTDEVLAEKVQADLTNDDDQSQIQVQENELEEVDQIQEPEGGDEEEQLPSEDENDENESTNGEEEIVIGEDEGWITKDNCAEIRNKLMGIKIEDNSDELLPVACITGDYAMQNVLLQMGLNVISPRDGLHIRRTRQFVLRCYACFKINPPTATQFCKFCGNMKTLKRVSVSVNADGTTKVHINFNKPINIRGTKYSLPAPRAGKHANNPILCEDMHAPQQRKSKLTTQEKKQLTIETILNEPDYLIRSNPFSVNDVYSRGSRVNTHSRKAVNPNETRKPTGNKKKKKNRYV